nr:hypothetical protein [Actinomycetales bacterium]
MHSNLSVRLVAEFLGTFVLVFGGCGSAVFAAQVLDGSAGVNMGIGFLGVALAFGLTVLTMAYAVGHISGGHFNPAVTLGALLAGRIDGRSVAPYMAVQVIGASAAGAVLYAIASGREGFDAVAGGVASNGYAERSPDGYSLVAVLIAETVLTAIFAAQVLDGSAGVNMGIGFLGVALAFGLTVLTMAYAVGHISGGHFNP